MKNVIFRFACDFVVHFFLFVLFMPSFRYVQILFDLVLYLVYKKWHSPFILRDSTFYSHTEPNWFHHHHQQPHHTTTNTASDISIHATVSNLHQGQNWGKKPSLSMSMRLWENWANCFSFPTIPCLTEPCVALFSICSVKLREKWRNGTYASV